MATSFDKQDAAWAPCADKQCQKGEYYKAGAAFGALVDDLPLTMH